MKKKYLFIIIAASILLFVVIPLTFCPCIKAKCQSKSQKSEFLKK